ncbi:hypothetical protein B0H14DRAFT_3620392, partial [Mycena olivaceomarginata]
HHILYVFGTLRCFLVVWLSLGLSSHLCLPYLVCGGQLVWLSVLDASRQSAYRMSRAKASRWHSGELERRAVRRAGAEQERVRGRERRGVSEDARICENRSGWIFRTNKGLGSRRAPKEQGAGGWRLEAVGTNERGEQDQAAVWAGAGAGAGAGRVQVQVQG